MGNLKCPKGFGRYTKIGLFINMYSGFIWGVRLKSKGTARSTVNALEQIFYDYCIPSTFMVDGGSHFNNGEVLDFCELNRVKHIITAANAPWFNGLIKGTNKLLLS